MKSEKHPRPKHAANRASRFLEEFARLATQWTGGSLAFALSILVIVVWAATGPIFHYSDTWQLVINTGTTIVTFIMVFLIQRTQNKDSMVIQLKLNEIIAALQGASNRMIAIENLTEDEVKHLHRRYEKLARLVQCDPCLTESHSIEEALKKSRALRAEAPPNGKPAAAAPAPVAAGEHERSA